MIETQQVTKAACGACGHVDYAPIEDEALLTLPGFQVHIIRADMVERGYACKKAHVGRVAKSLAETLEEAAEVAKPVAVVTDEASGLLAG